jgi:hypothetical protein
MYCLLKIFFENNKISGGSWMTLVDHKSRNLLPWVAHHGVLDHTGYSDRYSGLWRPEITDGIKPPES